MSERKAPGLGWFLLAAVVLIAAAAIYTIRQAPPTGPDPAVIAAARVETGGASTLEDILARQKGQDLGRPNRIADDTAAGNAAGLGGQLGPLGGRSDAEIWEDLRFGAADVTVSAGGAKERVLIQDNGMWWQEFRKGPLATYGGYGLLAVIALLALFYLVRGRIRISAGRAGVSIRRFTGIERFAHWLLAGSFLLLAFTGLITLFGRKGLIPLMGKGAYADLAAGSKWIHNNVSWAFMLALTLVFVFWVIHNLPDRTDWTWIRKGGGIFGKAHPPAKKFNFGQKMIFWSVVVLGISVSVSGLSLLFPFELPLFAKTFGVLNDLGVPALLGSDPLPTRLAPHAEMQYAQLWHAIVGFALMAIVIAHIYIGTIGMEGAFEAMGEGDVDLNWAKDHHSLWVEEVERKRGLPDEPHTTGSDNGRSPTPAE